ncbi:MAG TPA: PD-(D/E)XK nuclease family protein [Phycisphaerae bacterium]|nr:PD-(D/E)XK nuclease family protein [Phycisphaerae bacterium]
MPVRFIIGCAGSGKTQHCVDALVRAAENKPLGPPLFWLVPEQAAFMSERRLMAHPNLTGTFRIRVTGFRRLCRILAQQFAIPAEMELKPAERILLLSAAVQSCTKKLRAYGDSAQHPGFLTTLDRTLRELVQNNQTPESLARLSQLAETSSANPMLANKLADLSLLLQSWQQITGKEHPDPELFPQLVAQKLLALPPLTGTAVWIDAFSSMSLLEMQLCAALAKSADRMEITLLADPDSPVMQDPNAAPDELSIFYRTERLYKNLTGVLKKNNVTIEKPLRLEQNHRTSSAPALTLVEQHLFSRNGNLAPAKDNKLNEQIQIWHCRDPEEEVHAAGRFIRDRIAAGERYRDIGIIISDLAGYEEPIRRIFSSLNISYFLDSRRGITHHPLVLFLRTAMALPENKFSRSDWLVLVKTGLAGVDTNAMSLLENYLLAHGIDNDDFSTEWKWSRTFADPDADEPTEDQAALLATANELREKLRQAFAPWLDLTGQKEPIDGGRLTQGLIDLLNRLGTAKTLQEWIAEAQNLKIHQDDGAELAQMHQQLWTQTSELLSAMHRLFSDRKITPQHFSELLSLGLGTLTLGLIPPAIDHVLISSTERSRHPELQTVIVLGALEGLMPRLRRDESMLDDDDRRQLQESVGSGDSSFDLPSDKDFLQSTFFDYVAFTRAAKKMIVSVPLADSAGRKTVPSIHLARLRELFPDLEPQNLMQDQSPIAAAASIEDLIRAVALETGRGSLPEDAKNKTLLLGAYDWLKKQSDSQILAAMRRAWANFYNPSQKKFPTIPTELMQAIIKKPKSISELEKLAACRLQWFFRYVLGLRERSELMMEPKDLGNLYHRTLRAFFELVRAGKLNWGDYGGEELDQTLDQAVRQCATVLSEDLAQPLPELSIVLESLRRNLRELLVFHRDFAKHNHLRPSALELVFGSFPESDPDAPVLPAYSLKLADRTSVELRGKIDRVDADEQGRAIVIDYKLKTNKFEAANLEAGLSLQLMTYLLAIMGQKLVEAKNPLQPIGAFYQVLDPGFTKDEDEGRDFKMRGLFNNQQHENIDRVNNGKSEFVALSINQDGTFSKRGHDGIDSPKFQAVLDFTQKKLSELAKQALSGEIEPHPYRKNSQTPCGYCAFQSPCSFDRLRGTYRKITIKNKDALDEIISKGGIT